MTYHNISIEETLSALDTSIQGLTTNNISKLHYKYGENCITVKKNTKLLTRFFNQFADFMIIILILAAIISFIVSILEGHADFTDSIIILAIIVFNAILGVVQEYKAEHSLEALKKLSAPTAKVTRNKKIQILPSKELLPGDIIHLETGYQIPADARLINSMSLQVDESSLTGESHSVSKDASHILPENTSISDRKNMVYSGCMVTGGHAVGVITAIGIETEVGHIAKLISEDDAPQTPLQKKLSNTGKILGTCALAICTFIFIIGTVGGRPLFDMFMTSVSLAVASIPEGLPILVTIMLSIGVTRMSAKNAIIRKLPAVETLGSATYICSDKTGTLTQNKMTVTSIKDINGTVDNPKFILKLASMCTNVNFPLNVTPETPPASIEKDIVGEATETALVFAALKYGLSFDELSHQKRIYEIPFSSKRKLMTTVYMLNSTTYRYITKGAPDVLINLCTNILDNQIVTPLTSASKRHILTYQQNMAENALRTIAIAYKDLLIPPDKLLPADIENNLIFTGLVGMIDPPRKEAKEAVQRCQKAGIKPVMITGDHLLTAKAIATDLDILKKGDLTATGTELDQISTDTLNKTVTKYSVFARVSPSHKMRIVKALQHNNQIVAMTGDGVNDAPALKIADIGCSMGITGTDVAKNASDIILADDNFSTIVEAVKEGRGIYENIKKSIHFLLSSNIGEIITILFAILFKLPTPLLAVQLLWINLVTDSLPAVALGVEPVSKDVMNKKASLDHNLFTCDLTFKIIIEGIMIGFLALLAFILGYKILPVYGNPLPTARTMSFAVLGLSQLFHAFNMKSEHSIFKVGILNNKKLILAFFTCMFLQIVVISNSVFANVFSLVDLTRTEWFFVFLLSVMPIPIVELQKKLLS